MPDELYALPDLPYDPGALEPHIQGRITELYHGKHDAAYVKGANASLDKLHEVRAAGDFATITQLEKNLAFHVSGHVLHSVFWTNLSPDGSGDPSGELAEEIGSTFGSADTLRRHLSEAAATVQGSGWALLSWEPMARPLVVRQVYDHQGNHGQGSVPLLAIDAWEHAYYLQYQNEKAKFFDAIWNVVDWTDVERRFQAACSADLALLGPWAHSRRPVGRSVLESVPGADAAQDLVDSCTERVRCQRRSRTAGAATHPADGLGEPVERGVPRRPTELRRRPSGVHDRQRTSQVEQRRVGRTCRAAARGMPSRIRNRRSAGCVSATFPRPSAARWEEYAPTEEA